MTTSSSLEHLILDAWPALERGSLHGWTLLADAGVTGRVNAVAPFAFDGGDLERAIDDAIAWQTARGNRLCFKIADGVCAPPSLSDALAARGWRAHTETLVMTASISDALASLTGTVVPDAPKARSGNQAFKRSPVPWVPGSACGRPGMTEVLLTPEYAAAIDAVVRETSASAEEYAERSAIAQRTPKPRRFAVLERHGETAAVGLTVVTGAWAAIFLMRTHPVHRRQGLARAIVAALLGWAQSEGATHAFLQVEAANAPAIALYNEAGFTTAYAYRYWRPPADAAQ